jgi:hypothetical protein
MSVAEAYRSKSDAILHGHSNGARHLGDDGSAEDTFRNRSPNFSFVRGTRGKAEVPAIRNPCHVLAARNAGWALRIRLRVAQQRWRC